MEKDDLEKKRIIFVHVVSFLFLVLFMVLFVLLLSACHTNERVVEVVRTDTLIVQKVQRDSVYIEKEKHDSVFIHQRGDTVLIEKWHTEWRDRWREREKHDTIYVSKRDTVKIKEVVTAPTGKSLDTKRPWWERAMMTVGGWAIALLAVAGAGWLVRKGVMKYVRG